MKKDITIQDKITKINNLLDELDNNSFDNTKSYFKNESKAYLQSLQLKEYGYNLVRNLSSPINWDRANSDYAKFVMWNEKYTISWSDDDRQPKSGDIVYILCFPCGAYTFDRDYPVDFFKKFWNQLLLFTPDYKDTTNKTLYWKIENGVDIHNKFPEIFKKYQELNEIDRNKRLIQAKKREIEDLEKTLK